MAAIFDFQQTQTSDSILTSLSVLPNPENIGVTVEILLLSCIRDEIYRISNLPPINGRHFELRRQFSSAIITVTSDNSDVLKKT